MAALALVGITGMYLYQVTEDGRAGAGRVRAVRRELPRHRQHLVRRGYVLPAIADTSPSYVENVLVAASGHHPPGDTGAL